MLLKGGHLSDSSCPAAIVGLDGVHEVLGERIATRHTHGTGCSLSSALATLRAAGSSWPDALVRAKDWLTGALAHADALHVGSGNGPIDHFHELRRRTTATDSGSAGAWDASAGVRAQVDAGHLVRGPSDGSLPRKVFHRYVAQDALYLGEYARMLARASALAPTADEPMFWGRSAGSAIVEERRLHETHVGSAASNPEPHTLAYMNHLHASAVSYGELVAALLPCLWLYADLGTRLPWTRHPPPSGILPRFLITTWTSSPGASFS